MSAVLRAPHKLYKRYQSAIESAITALGLGLLVAVVLINLPVYPTNWAPVLVTMVIVLGLRWAPAAYIVAALTLIYPIYTISLYLAILFVALATLTLRPFSHYLGATVLFLAVPWLAKYHLHWLIPILAGLWWGSVNGFWIGGAAALWGKLIGGMAGLEIDWLLLDGQSPSIAGLMQRFHGLEALEMLLKIVQPFAVDATVLLYHLLQITLWAMIGLLVGTLSNQQWLRHKFPLSTLIITATGTIGLIAGHIALASWLAEVAPASVNYSILMIGALSAFALGSCLETSRRFLDFPLAPKKQQTYNPQPITQMHIQQQPVVKQSVQSKLKPIPLPDLPEWEPPEEDNGLILLELD